MDDITLIHGDCLEVMRGMEEGSVDLVITSPPYWNQRMYSYWKSYKDYLSDVEKWVWEISRILKQGRHCFWIIPDKFPFPPKENGTKERLYMPVYSDTEKFAYDSGLICEFPIIWKKNHGSQKMFGSYPYPPTIIHSQMTERICVWRKPGKPNLSRKTEDSKLSKNDWINWAQDLWNIAPDSKQDHPAIFPLKIPKKIITLWSFHNDIILDPFMGSGTTGEACFLTNRKFIGIEIDETFFSGAEKRLKYAQQQIRMPI